MKRLLRALCSLATSLAIAGPALAQGVRAEGFTRLPAGARVALMPPDVELYAISAGGIPEPREDWTRAAQQHIRDIYRERKAKAKVEVVELPEDGDEAVEHVKHLHGAVARAILLHHRGQYALPSKQGRLDWTLGPDIEVLRKKSGADYALFLHVRDSYATTARVLTVFVSALFGAIVMPGGVQQISASLVDLRSGQVVWFHRLERVIGDLRERDAARETLDSLLYDAGDAQ
jgi:hypothetical protein